MLSVSHSSHKIHTPPHALGSRSVVVNVRPLLQTPFSLAYLMLRALILKNRPLDALQQLMLFIMAYPHSFSFSMLFYWQTTVQKFRSSELFFVFFSKPLMLAKAAFI